LKEACYKGELPHFEISVKFLIFNTHIDLFAEKKFLIYLGTFSLFWAQKTHLRIAIHEYKEKRLFYFGLIILLSIQIQLWDIENPKIDSPYCTHNGQHLCYKKLPQGSEAFAGSGSVSGTELEP
jgi:hypothetical protein